MHYGRAILVSIISYLITLAVGIGALVVSGESLPELFPPSKDLIFMSMILAFVFTTGAAIVYFSPDTVKASGKLGLGFGLIATLTAFLLDGLLAIALLFQGKNPADLFSVAYDPVWVVALIGLTFIATTVVGIQMGQMQIWFPSRK